MKVVAQITVEPQDSDMRLDRWFHKRYPTLGHGRLEKLLRTGQIRVDGARAKANVRLAAGQVVRVPPLGELTMPKDRPAPRIADNDARELQDRVLFKDDWVIALDKPPGLAVQGGSKIDRHLDGMLDALRFEAEERPRLVHRLDKDTSGVLLLARSQQAAQALAKSFKDRTAAKIYWALVAGVPQIAQGKIDAPLAKIEGAGGERMMTDDEEGKRAITLYAVLETAGRKAAWLALHPVTGRTHQLRAHCALMEHPIIGDGKYGAERAFLTGSISRKLHLHARAIDLPHPHKGRLKVTAPLPKHMRQSWELLGFNPDDTRNPFVEFHPRPR